MRRTWIAAALAAAGGSVASHALADPPLDAEPARASTPLDVRTARAVASRLPLAFEVNRGQAPAGWDFLVRCRGYHAFVSSQAVVFSFDGAALTMSLDGAERVEPATDGLELPGKANYFLGNDPAKWLSNVPLTRGARYDDVAASTAWSFGGDGRALEFAFDLAPGADAPRLTFDGAKSVRVADDGSLRLAMPHGEATIGAPVAWQEADGRRIDARAKWTLAKDGVARIETSPKDAQRPVHVDPTVSYATYLGGSSNETDNDAAMDATGAVYLAGFTSSSNFPATTGAYSVVLTPNSGSGGNNDGFVVKVNAAGTALSYATYIGATKDDYLLSIAVDAAGDAFVGGWSYDVNWPTTAGVFQPSASGGTPYGVVAELSPSGASLVFSTYAATRTNAVALGPSGSVYFTDDLGLTRISAGATAQVFYKRLRPTSTPNGQDMHVTGLAADAAGDAYVLAYGNMTNFAATSGAYQTTYAGGTDVVLSKINSSGSIVFTTFVGGNGDERTFGVDVNFAGQAYAVGSTQSTNLPVTSGAFRTSLSAAGHDAFVTRVNASGTGLRYSSYLGPGDALDVRVHPYSSFVVVGDTYSTVFPVSNAFQSQPGGDKDAFLMKFDRGNTLAWSSYCGGSGADTARGLAMGTDGSVGLAGETGSSNFPTVSPLQSSHGGGQTDAFTLVVHDTLPANPVVLAVAPTVVPTTTVGYPADPFQLTASGGAGPQTWALASGAPPNGMSLGADGVVSGTPTLTGTFNFTVRADDSSEMSATAACTLRVNPPPSIGPSLGAATSGTPYDRVVPVIDGSGVMTFGFTGGVLPSGLSLATTGRVTGTPTQTGDYSFSVAVEDGRGAPGSGAVAIHVNDPPAIRGGVVPQATEGRPYAFQPIVDAGTAPFAWSLAAGASPAGAIVAATGRIAGTAKAAGDYALTLRATDANGAVADRAVVVKVNALPQIAAAELPRPALGRPYRYSIPVSGGTAPFTWSIDDGSLPSGLALSAAGEISGTPTAEDGGIVDVRCTDANGATTTLGFECVVASYADLAKKKAAKTYALTLADPRTIRRYVELMEGAAFGVSLTGGGAEGIGPEVRVYGPSGEEWDVSASAKATAKSVVVRGAVVPATGRYFVVGRVAARFAGKAKLTISIAPRATWTGGGPLSAAPTEFRFSSPPGAKVSISVKATGSAALPRIVSLVGPDATDLVPGGKSVEKGGAATFSTKTPLAGGEWRVVFATRDGSAGDVAWTVKLKLPKTYTFALPDVAAGD